MRIDEVIARMESCTTKYSSLQDLHRWINEAIPEQAGLGKVQVAGTNGKGSTCRWLSNLCQLCGYRVGVFSSPHLVKHNERIAINGQAISDEDFVRLYEQYEPAFLDHQLTMFEMDVWLAVAYFVEQKVDLAIFEVGLGGRLDATTALDVGLHLITNIGYDHMEFLGDSLEQIAFEKAGIFKPGVIALTTETQPACQRVFEQVAGQMGTQLGFVSLPYEDKEDWIEFEYLGKHRLPKPTYQFPNLLLALEAGAIMGLEFDGQKIDQLIREFHWPGRLDVVQTSPLIILDGAHNQDGVKALRQALPEFEGTIYVNILKDKQADKMLAMLAEYDCPIVWVNRQGARVSQAPAGLETIELDELKQKLVAKQEPMLICGSLYLLGDLL